MRICRAVLVVLSVIAAVHGNEINPEDLSDEVKAQMPDIFGGSALGTSLPGVTRDQHCEGCKIVMSEVNKQLNIKESRTFKETQAYLNEMCEDIEGWYPAHVGQVCRSLVPEHTMTIQGLIQMSPGNLEDSVCALFLKVCPEPEKEHTPADSKNNKAETKMKGKRKKRTKRSDVEL